MARRSGYNPKASPCAGIASCPLAFGPVPRRPEGKLRLTLLGIGHRLARLALIPPAEFLVGFDGAWMRILVRQAADHQLGRPDLPERVEFLHLRTQLRDRLYDLVGLVGRKFRMRRLEGAVEADTEWLILARQRLGRQLHIDEGGVDVGVTVEVPVALLVGAGVNVPAGVCVEVLVEVGVGVSVLVGVGVLVALLVGVGVDVLVKVGVGVPVEVAVGVAVGL